MTTLLLILLMGALGVGGMVFALSLAREKGALAERLRRLEEQAEIDRKRAEIMAQARTDNETIDRLGDGTF